MEDASSFITPQRRTPLDGLRVVWTRHRRAWSALFAAIAVALTAAATAPPPTPSVPVVVAGRPLPGGQRLAASDLRVAHYPPQLVPAGHCTDPEQLAGRVLAVGTDAGLPLTERLLVGSRRTQGDGRVIAPVRLTDADLARLVTVGDQVDVLATTMEGTPARTIAHAARVAALPAQGGSGPLGGSSSGDPLVLLEVDAATAATIAGHTGSRLTLVLR